MALRKNKIQEEVKGFRDNHKPKEQKESTSVILNLAYK